MDAKRENTTTKKLIVACDGTWMVHPYFANNRAPRERISLAANKP